MPVRVWVPSPLAGEWPIDYPTGDNWGIGPQKELDVLSGDGAVATLADGQWKRVEFHEDALPPVALPEPEEGSVHTGSGYIAKWPSGDPAHPDGLPEGAVISKPM